MTSHHLDRVKTLLDEVGALPAAARDAYLEAHCDDAALRAEVESLLAYDSAEPAWPEAPLLTAPAEAPTPWVEQLKPGIKVGPYRVVQPLGVGGMGAVAAAVREGDFAKTVAVKVLHEQPSRQAVRRFHEERQILAGLEHPNIARILDGGTTDDGRPYFAMELVAGLAIDVHCERHGLDVEATIRLVLKVCSALEVAHRRLIVHRDIKPTNIIVGADGEPKLLDFGIAKRLGPEVTDLTRMSHRPMTLRYASPEQVVGASVTTATDVWGVGVLLYQLLTGTHPFGSLDSGALDVAEAIRDQASPRPSSATADPARARRLAGDLDAILLRALRKEPEHRYGSIEAFAADLRAYLDDRPVDARRGGRVYVVRRFLRRYRWPLAAVATIVLLSVAFGIVSWVLLQRAEEQRGLAQLGEEKALASLRAVQSILFELKPRAADQEADKVARDTFAAAVRKVERQEVMDEKNDEIRLELLAALSTVYTAWGEIDNACRVATFARRDAQGEFAPDAPQVLLALNNEATCRFHQEDFASAASLWDQVLTLLERQGADDGRLSSALANAGTGRHSLGQVEEALALYRRALDLRLGLAARHPNNRWEERVAMSWRNLSVVHLDLGEIDAAEAAARQAIEWLGRVDDSDIDKLRSLQATLWLGLARILDEQPHEREATESLYRRGLAVREQRYGPAHDLVALAKLDLARFLLEGTEFEEARALLDDVLAQLDDPRDRARAQSVQALYLSRVGRVGEAEALLEQSFKELTRGRQVLDIHARRTAEWLEQVRAEAGALRHANGATDDSVAPRESDVEVGQGASSTETLRSYADPASPAPSTRRK